MSTFLIFKFIIMDNSNLETTWIQIRLRQILQKYKRDRLQDTKLTPKTTQRARIFHALRHESTSACKGRAGLWNGIFQGAADPPFFGGFFSTSNSLQPVFQPNSLTIFVALSENGVIRASLGTARLHSCYCGGSARQTRLRERQFSVRISWNGSNKPFCRCAANCTVICSYTGYCWWFFDWCGR